MEVSRSDRKVGWELVNSLRIIGYELITSDKDPRVLIIKKL